MRPVSEAFLSAVPFSHQMVARVRLCTPGQQGVNPGPINATTGEPEYPLAINDGDVFLNAAAQIRAIASLSVSSSWPVNQSDMLFPNGGAELFIERGIQFGDGSREWISQGYFRLDDVEQDDAPDGPIEIEASDRMAAIIDARLVQPRQYFSGQTKRAVIEDLVLELYPTVTVVLSGFDGDAPMGADQICERDRYKFLNDLAKAHGCTMFFNYAGNFVMQPVPDYATTEPMWKINHGASGVLIRLGRRLSRASVFNAVVADGEQATDAEAVQGIAYDLNTQSPTRWNGPFKQVPRFWQSSFLRTQEQADNAAAAMLARSIGTPYVVDFNVVPNPALEPLDLVEVSYSDAYASSRHIVDTLRIPLVASRSMSGTTRMQPLEVDG